jgi:hypothetical protein
VNLAVAIRFHTFTQILVSMSVLSMVVSRSSREKETVEVVFDTSTGTAIRVAHCGLMLEGLRLSYAQAR